MNDRLTVYLGGETILGVLGEVSISETPRGPDRGPDPCRNPFLMMESGSEAQTHPSGCCKKSGRTERPPVRIEVRFLSGADTGPQETK